MNALSAFRAMIAREDNNLASIEALLAGTAPATGDLSNSNGNPFVDVDDSIETVTNERELGELVAHFATQASEAGELSQQRRLRAYVAVAKGVVKLRVKYDEKGALKTYAQHFLPHGSPSVDAYASKLRAYCRAAECGGLDATLARVWSGFASRTSRDSLENAMYKALVVGRDLAKLDKSKGAPKFVAPDVEHVAKVLNPPAPAKTEASADGEAGKKERTLDDVVSSAASAVKSKVRNAEDVAHAVAAFKLALEASLPAPAPAPVTDPAELAKPVEPAPVADAPKPRRSTKRMG